MDALYAWMWWQQVQAGCDQLTPSEARATQEWLDGILVERLKEQEAVDGRV